MIGAGIEGGMVGIPLAHHSGHSYDGRLPDVAVIEKNPVADPDLVPQQVSSLEVAHPVPVLDAVGTTAEIIE
jgi:hypothetical protein